MYIYIYIINSVHIYLLCMIKVVYLKSVENVITFGKLIGLLFLFSPPSSLFCFENSKINIRNELARPVMGTIFLVYWPNAYWLPTPLT